MSAVFSKPRLPTWGVLELLVEAMGGEAEEFRSLWLAATTPISGAPGPPFVGRTRERQVLRDHLTGGEPGVLLVTGEAGIGKSALVEVAARDADPTTVLTGWCRPLSRDAPLLPVADWLRSAHRLDGGALAEVVASSPPYVGPVLAALLPELETGLLPVGPLGGSAREQDDDLARLFAALSHVLTALAELRPLGLLLEDAHWADPATLELVEYLALRTRGAPTVATWRSADPGALDRAREWRTRVGGMPGVRVLSLGPLTSGQTFEQLRLLGVRDAAAARSIQQRSLGHPLFTEQLAARPAGDAGPDDAGLFDDLIGRRLTGLGSHARVVSDLLGVSDRPLGWRVLAVATGLAPAALADGARELGVRHLLRSTDQDDTELRHPLVAEAIRRRMTTVDRAEAHRRLAGALEADGRHPAVEIAEHWRRADQPEHEWPWRARAAKSAAARFALTEAADQWCRAIDLWPAGTGETVDGVRLLDAYLSAIAARVPVDLDAAVKLAADALAAFPQLEGLDAAMLYRRAAEPRGLAGDPQGALVLVDRAIDILEVGPPTAELVHALTLRVVLCWALNMAAEGDDASARGLAISAELDDVALHRQMLAVQGQHDADAGRLDLALERLEQAQMLRGAGPDPQIDVLASLLLTNVLVEAEAGADRVVEAGRPGLEAAESWGLDTTWAAILRGNISDGLRRAGRVEEAAALVDPVTTGRPTPNRVGLHIERAALDLLRGRQREARDRIVEVQRIYPFDTHFRAFTAGRQAWIDLWCGHPQHAYDVATDTLQALVDDPSVDLSELLTLGARAAVEVVQHTRPRAGRAHEEYGERLRGLASAAACDPFSPHPTVAARPALAATWVAELHALDGEPDSAAWLQAATAWDRLDRPFDAAYCRWQAGRLAIAIGRRSSASTLLRHAYRQARGHQPLRVAISATEGVVPRTEP